MNAIAKRDSLPSVTAAAIVAIIFSLFGALGGLLGGISMLLLPDLPTTRNAPSMPQGVRAMAATIMLFLLALAVFGIFVAIGILRRRNWARITILVWGGLMAIISAVSIPFIFLVFNSLPSTLPPGEDAAPIMGFMKLFMIFLYGIPLGVGIWWLMLFTRPRVVMAFAAPAPMGAYPPPAYPPNLDVTGFPLAEPVVHPAFSMKAACPLPLMILAGFLVFSAAFMLLAVLFPLTGSMPFFFFGHFFGGVTAKILLGLMGVIFGVAGIGIFKLKPAALDALLVLYCLFFVNGVLSLLSPRFLTVMQEAMQRADAANPAFPGGNPFLTSSYIHSILLFGLFFSVAIIAFLFFYRSRFLEAASKAKI